MPNKNNTRMKPFSKFYMFLIVSLLSQSVFVLAATNDNNSTKPKNGLSPNLFRNSASTDYSVGLWAGQNYTNITFSGLFHIAQSIQVMPQYRYSNTFGISGHYKKNDSWSYQAELNIEQKGMFIKDEFYSFMGSTRLTNNINSNLNLNYFSLPVLANFHFGRVTKWYVSGGLYYSYLRAAALEGTLSAEIINDFNDHEIVEVEINYPLSSSYRSDAGAVVGAGFIFPIQKGPHGNIVSLVLDARYYQGVLNVYSGEPIKPLDPLATINPNIVVEVEPPLNENMKLRTSTFSLRLGLVVAI